MKQQLVKKLTRTRLKEFLQQYGSDARTLDIGASESAYQDLFPNRVALDIEKKEGVDVVADAHQLPFEDESFEQVLCTEVLEHLHTPQLAISEMHRVLARGGRLILTTRFLYPLHDSPYDYFRFTKYGLLHLLRDFEIEALVEEGSTGETFTVLIQTLAHKSKLRGGKFAKAMLLILAWKIKFISLFISKEIVSGRNATPYVEENSMTSGYYVVCKKK